MFVELLPLLQKRSVIITACALSDSEVLLTITQNPKDKDEKSLKPYTLQGPASEVDAILAEQLKGHTDTVLGFHSSLEDLKASTEATLKEAKADADKKIADAKNKTGKPNASASKPTPAAKPEPPKAPEPPSLFDTAPAAVEVSSQVASTASAWTAEVDDDDIDPEDEPNGSDDEEDASEDVSHDASASVQTPVAASAVTASAQSSMFTTSSQHQEEEEILQEAFNGGENQLIAA